VPIKFLTTILNNDCEYLSLHEAKIHGTNFSSKPLQLKYLELNWCQSGTISSSDYTIVEELLRYCYSLEKLSLSWLEIKPCIFNIISIQNGNTLQTLNLHKTRGLNLDLESFQSIIDNCVNLEEVNLYGTNLTGLQINYLANNLTKKIAKLCLQSEENLTDEHVKSLVFRCKKLTTLDLGDTKITDDSLNSIIENLKPTLEELDVSYTNIGRGGDFPGGYRNEEFTCPHTGEKKIRQIYLACIKKLLELKTMPQLRILICRGVKDNNIAMLRIELNVCINQGCLKIANSDQVYEPMDGFWEIEAKQLKLFQSRSNRQTFEQRRNISRTGTW